MLCADNTFQKEDFLKAIGQTRVHHIDQYKTTATQTNQGNF